MDEMLKKLPETADSMMNGVEAGQELKNRIYQKAQGTEEKTVRFRPARAIPAICCALVFVFCIVYAVPSLVRGKDTDLTSQAAGVNVLDNQNMRADLPDGSLTLLTGSVPSFKNLWSKASGAEFPMIRISGKTYRMLTAPGSLSSSRLGNAVGQVDDFSEHPVASGVSSNAVQAGETVFAVKGVSGAVAAKVSGKMRVFQRVSYDGQGRESGETLRSLLTDGKVVSITLSGVGEASDESAVQALYAALADGATYQGADCRETSSTLLITCSNGVTLQLYTDGTDVMGCGRWNCPEFFAMFK